MGRIILHYQISLDGIVSDVENWATMSDELMESSIGRYDNLEAAIFGSKTYPSIAEYWQNAEKSSESPFERALAEILNRTQKYVISRSKVELTWRNSRQITIEDVESLKKDAKKDIAVESGTGLWQLFFRKSLFDEIQSFVHPVIVGSNEKLFTGDETKTSLKLTHSKLFKNGVVELRHSVDKK